MYDEYYQVSYYVLLKMQNKVNNKPQISSWRRIYPASTLR